MSGGIVAELDSLASSPRARVETCIRRWIQEGRFERGQELPSEAALARRLSVARGTVRAALKRLESSGLIEVGEGRLRRVTVSDLPLLPGSVLERTVVMLAPSIYGDPRHKQGGWSDWITQGMIHEARSRGLHSLTLDPAVVTPAELESLAGQKLLGVAVPEVFRGLRSDAGAVLPLVERLGARGVPTVVYGGDERLAGFDRVTSDHEGGAFALTQWLIGQGRRRPMMLVEKSPVTYWGIARRRGYERALREAGLEPLPALQIPEFPSERAPDAEFFESVSRYVAGYLLDVIQCEEPTDAILAMSDGKTFPIIKACQLLGRRVHEDVAVVGYDNYWADSWERQYIDARPLATVDKRNFEIGQEMIRLLLNRVEGKLPEAPQTTIMQTQLIAGTDVPAGNGDGSNKSLVTF